MPVQRKNICLSRGTESLPPVIASFGLNFIRNLAKESCQALAFEGLTTRPRLKNEKSLKICSVMKRFIRSGGSADDEKGEGNTESIFGHFEEEMQVIDKKYFNLNEKLSPEQKLYDKITTTG